MRRQSRTLTVFIAGPLTTSLAYLAFLHLSRDRSARDAPDPAEVKASRHCIAEITRHEPEIDADRDLARGDLTPIGMTYVPHDPPEPSTFFEGACEKSYAGVYRPTGKWFTYTSNGFTFAAHSKEYHQCRGAARRYIIRYNRRMTARAPDDVMRFCAAQRLDDSGRRSVATEAVFGSMIRKKGYVQGAIVDTAIGRAYLTKPVWLIDTGSGPALVTESRKAGQGAGCIDGSCAEAIGVAYLTENGQHMVLRRRWPLVHQINRDGWKRGSIACCGPNRRTLHPELSIEETIVENGCRMGRETLVELTPGGPIVRGVIPFAVDPTAKSDGPARFGRVENVVRGRSFDVVVPQSDIVEHYQLRGAQFVGPGKSDLRC